jgi:adenosylcobyric acid synthase
MELFRDGVRILEEKTGRPCLGVFPYVPDLTLDPEDTLNIEDRAPGNQPVSAPSRSADGELRIGIIRLPHISNFTDFRLLPHATYLTQPTREHFDVIFIPGTKNTMDDMVWLRDSGLEGWLLKQAWSGARIVGICGGYQLLGESISDPYSVESSAGSVRGLGLIPANTILMPEKTTRRVTARTPSGIRFHAYEIHMGVTSVQHPMEPFARIEDGGNEGVRMAGIAGTYLHGALESQEVLEELLGRRLPGPPPASKDVQYDRLADWFALHVNDRIFEERYLKARKGAGL